MRDQAPTSQGLRVYPRGFLGANIGVRIQDTLRPFNSMLQTHQYHHDMFKPQSMPVEVNWNIEEMYRYMLKTPLATGDMKFRERVLRLALQSFGTNDWYTWVSANYKGPATGELHAEFIEDCLVFIRTGKRRMSCHVWATLLQLSDIGTNVTNMDAIEGFFVDPMKPSQLKPYSLVDILQLWCGHDGGFEDLAQSLHVLFGDTNY